MGSSEKFCLRWNDFESNISGAFRELREDKDFFDVTLACDDEQLQAHKVILSACSPFFRTVLRRNRHEHPLLYLKGVKYADLVSVLNFMYHGEVNVAQEELNSFLAVAEDLKVKGLTQGNSSSDSKASHSAPPPRPDPPKARLPDPTPQVKRPRPGPSPSQPPRQIAPAQPAYSQEQDDDIQEVAPIVKSEPATHVPAEAQYPQGQGIVADPNMEYGEEYGEYEGYEEGDYDNSMMDPNMAGADGNKGLLESILDHKLEEGGAELEAAGQAADTLLEQHIERSLEKDSLSLVYLCRLCNKACKSRDECANHIEVHHLKIVRSCPYCGMDQTSRGGLRQHISRKHREEHRLAKGLKTSGRIKAPMDQSMSFSYSTPLSASPFVNPSAASTLSTSSVTSKLDVQPKL